LLAKRITHSLQDILLIYELRNSDIELFLMGRPWLSAEDFNVEIKEINDTLEKQINKEILDSSNLNLFPSGYHYEKSLKLKSYEYSNVYIANYGVPVLDKKNNLIGYKIFNGEYASVEIYYNEDNLLCYKVSIREFDKNNLSFKNEVIKNWIDIKTEGGFIREFNKKIFYYDKKNNLINVEISFNCPKFPIYKKDDKFEAKIGTIDFETFGDNLGFGFHKVYAAGFAIKNKTELFYIELGETSDEFVYKFFWRLFLNNKNLNGYTFYVHNLGRFDSVFIIKALTKDKDFIISPIWKDNSILSLTIEHFKTKIINLDSLQLIPGNLDNILKSFNCSIKKNKFPYKAVSKKTLFYIGNRPNKNFFNNILDQEYLTIPEKNWDMKKETLNYLKSDVEGLLEAIIKFRDNIYSKYKLNITKFKTLSGLALAVYTSHYIPNNLIKEFKMIKGSLEKEIRSSYFGGNVDVYINKINGGYLYDINSQYSKAMLNDMPVGDPILSLETNLDNIFGFVFGEITCPDENILQVPFIQNRDPIWNLNNYPRGKFKRLIFSEEIKYALKFGYTINIEYCYQFKKGKDFFKKYVNDHYEIKSSSTDPVQKAIAKLFLNSLYGRMGINETENVMKIVDKKEAEILDKDSNVSILSELNDDKYLVKYNGKINDNIRSLYSKDPLTSDKKKIKNYSKKELRNSKLNKPKYISSAVHIAAAISSYARIIINEYKNIPGNTCIMSDTDSVVLTKPLPNNLISKELGKIKLEQEIKEGIFIKKKLYCILNSQNQEIIKSSGLDSSKLNYNSFINLLNGESVEIEITNFNLDWKTLNINIKNSIIKIQGLTGEIKTLYNTPDVNFKFISFLKNYSIIKHPLLFKIEKIISTVEQVKKLKINLIIAPDLAASSLNNKDKLIIIIFLITLLSSFSLLFFSCNFPIK